MILVRLPETKPSMDAECLRAQRMRGLKRVELIPLRLPSRMEKLWSPKSMASLGEERFMPSKPLFLSVMSSRLHYLRDNQFA